MSITVAMSERTRQYIETAIWADLQDDAGNPADKDYDASDVAPGTVRQIEAAVDAFFTANAADIEATGSDDGRTAHNLYLSRNGHGAGFFGNGYGPAGDRLQDAARALGESQPYLGDDGRVYFT